MITKREKMLIIIIFGWMIIMVGAIMNFEAVISNGGKMPFLADYDYEGEKHFSFQDYDEINYPYLTDIIKINNFHFSIGDSISLLGASFLIVGLGMFASLIRKQTQLKDKQNQSTPQGETK